MDTIEDIKKQYPIVNGLVDGRIVRDSVPNMDSISASLDDYEILPGIREVKFNNNEITKLPQYYSSSEELRTKKLADAIKNSNQITPLIVVIDKEGSYILEGGHRYDALREIGAKSYPAVIVVDTETILENNKINEQDAIILTQNDEINRQLKQLVNSWKSKGIDIVSYVSNGKLHISRIVVPKELRGQGYGSSAMQDLTKFADQNNLIITLSPATDFGASSVNRLKQFYKKFGFVVNKGKYKDYTISDTMYRNPITKIITESLKQKLKTVFGN